MSDDESFPKDIELIITKIEQNCLHLSEYHKNEYFYYKNLLSYFRLPTIILSAINSVFSVSLVNFINQEVVSFVTCFINLIVAIINSVELYLQIQNIMEQENKISKEFFKLHLDTWKVLSLDDKNRHVDPKMFLEETYNRYSSLVHGSKLIVKLKKVIHNIDEKEVTKIISHPTTPSNNDTFLNLNVNN